MASVAICPHCNLQLIIPDHVANDAHVQCPTCHEEFDLQEAVLHSVPEVVLMDPLASAPETAAESAGTPPETYDAGPNAGFASQRTIADVDRQLDTAEQADHDFAAWFSADKTVADAAPPPRTPTLADLWPERAKSLPPEADAPQQVAAESAQAASLAPASLSLESDRPEHVPLGPSFDLPNVPLTPDNTDTIELGVESSPSPAETTDFALDDVDFDAHAPAAGVKRAAASHGPVGTRGPALDAYAPFIVPPSPARRRRSAVRTLVGAALGGVAGLAIGYYLFLYFLGPQGDFLQVADRVPRWLLPTSFAAAPSRILDAAETSSHLADDAASDGSANISASYAKESQPDRSPAARSDHRSADDRYGSKPAAAATNGQEPAQFEELPAAPLATDLPPAVEAPHLANAPTYTAEQLSAALEAARQAQPSLENGDLSDPAVRRTKGLSYAKFCDLAQMSTFCEATSGSEVEQLERDAEALFRATLANAHTRDEVARIADIWIDSPNRRHGGVFLTGNLNGGEIAGDMYEYQLSTENASSVVLLLAHPPEGPASNSGRPVAVVGAIVERPAREVAGYTGDAPRAIWVSRLIPLD